MTSGASLDQAVDAICAALHDHAALFDDGVPDPAVVIASGEDVKRTVLEHERILFRVGHWSSPLRHLGGLPSVEDAAEPSDVQSEARPGARYIVTLSYEVNVTDESEVVALAEGRSGQEAAGVADALAQFASDVGWDAAALPLRGLLLISSRVDVSAAGED